MRTTPCWLLAGLLVACGSEAAPSPLPMVDSATAERAASALPASGSPIGQGAGEPVTGERVTGELGAGERGAGDTPTGAAAADIDHPGVIAAAQRLVREAAAAGPVQQAKAPAALRALGAGALPALTTALRAENVTERRIAALTLLQWSDDLHRDGGAGDVVAALAAARDDADPSVRAAAQHAYRRAIGDTSALDATRAADEAAMRGDR